MKVCLPAMARRCCFCPALSSAQTASPQPTAASSAQPAPQQASGRYTDRLHLGKRDLCSKMERPVRLRINRTISSADAHTGDTVDFRGRWMTSP